MLYFICYALVVHGEYYPHEFPNWKTVYYYFLVCRLNGFWERVNAALRTGLRITYGREQEPSAAILDSQSVKTTETPGVRGYDAAKKVKGRKRHILVDTIGLLLIVLVHTANIQDRDGAKLVPEQVKGKYSRLELIWADAGYSGQLVDWVNSVCGWILEIVRRSDDLKGFQVLPHRWVVERTFGCLCDIILTKYKQILEPDVSKELCRLLTDRLSEFS